MVFYRLDKRLLHFKLHDASLFKKFWQNWQRRANKIKLARTTQPKIEHGPIQSDWWELCQGSWLAKKGQYANSREDERRYKKAAEGFHRLLPLLCLPSKAFPVELVLVGVPFRSSVLLMMKARLLCFIEHTAFHRAS